MTINELILITSDKVRRDPSLMAFYIESYQSVFGRKPNCAGCTFSTDWKNFINAVSGSSESKKIQPQIKSKMGTFKLKKLKYEILSYKVGKTVVRKYDNKLTDEFVEGFLTHGTPEQLEQRKAMFAVLPEKPQEAKVEPSENRTEDKEPTKPKAKRNRTPAKPKK